MKSTEEVENIVCCLSKLDHLLSLKKTELSDLLF